MLPPRELEPGALVTYHGALAVRSMQRACILVSRNDMFVALRFLGGSTLLANRRHVTRVTAPQWEPDF